MQGLGTGERWDEEMREEGREDGAGSSYLGEDGDTWR